MTSKALRRWMTFRSNDLDEIEEAHLAVGGTARGRRHATQQLNRAYAVLLASHFQGFCRDIYSECVDELIVVVKPISVQPILRAEFTWNRQLDRGNASPDNLGSDFGRLGIKFWPQIATIDPKKEKRQKLLSELLTWRNAIAHQDLDPTKLSGSTSLRLEQVRRWRKVCNHLARSFDKILRRHLQSIVGTTPW